MASRVCTMCGSLGYKTPHYLDMTALGRPGLTGREVYCAGPYRRFPRFLEIKPGMERGVEVTSHTAGQGNSWDNFLR